MLYQVRDSVGRVFVSSLFKEPVADQNFGVRGSGAAAAGATAIEQLIIRGPEKSTNNSTSFTATVTWIAIL